MLEKNSMRCEFKQARELYPEYYRNSDIKSVGHFSHRLRSSSPSSTQKQKFYKKVYKLVINLSKFYF